MCGEYAAFLTAEAVARQFQTVNAIPAVPFAWQVTPTRNAMIVRRHPTFRGRHLEIVRWGLVHCFTNRPNRTYQPVGLPRETISASARLGSAFVNR